MARGPRRRAPRGETMTGHRERRMHRTPFASLALVVIVASSAAGDVGDPQVRTDHPWYPGELSCSTFERLFATQAGLYRRVTGVEPRSDQDQALASWLWRDLHYWHCEEGGRQE